MNKKTLELLAQAIAEDVIKTLKELGYYIGGSPTKAEIYHAILKRLETGVEI